MGILRTHIRKALWAGPLLVAMLLFVGCSGIQPYHPPNHREEGPSKGLFTGSQGEWVILGPKAPQKDREEKNKGEQETEYEREQKKQPEKSADGYQ
jgi:hypothetical protein